MQTKTFDLYFNVILTEVNRLYGNDFGVMYQDAGNAPTLEKMLHERHQVFNVIDKSELYKNMVSGTQDEWQGYFNHLPERSRHTVFAAKDMFNTENKNIQRQLADMDGCLQAMDSDNDTKERIKLLYKSLLIKYSVAVNEFFDEVDNFGIKLVGNVPSKIEHLEQQIKNNANCKYKFIDAKYWLVKKIHKYLSDTESIKDIDYTEFLNDVLNADFSKEYNGKKCNIRYTMDALRIHFVESWGVDICNSVGIDKNKITSHNVTNEFKRNFPR